MHYTWVHARIISVILLWKYDCILTQRKTTPSLSWHFLTDVQYIWFNFSGSYNDRWCLRYTWCDIHIPPLCNMWWTRLRYVIWATFLHFIFAKKVSFLQNRSRRPKIDDTNLSSIRKYSWCMYYKHILRGRTLAIVYLLICVPGSIHINRQSHYRFFSAKYTIICDSRSIRKTRSYRPGGYTQSVTSVLDKHGDRIICRR